MSANNYILIKENKKNFKVMMLDAETSYQFGKATKCTNLRDACLVAERRCNEEDVEYGVRFDFREHKLNYDEPLIRQLVRDAKCTVPEMRKKIKKLQQELNQFG
jgi:hypothetical protein